MKSLTLKALLLGTAVFVFSGISFDANAGCSTEISLECDGDGCKAVAKLKCTF